MPEQPDIRVRLSNIEEMLCWTLAFKQHNLNVPRPNPDAGMSPAQALHQCVEEARTTWKNRPWDGPQGTKPTGPPWTPIVEQEKE